jgi:hypothetical protein
MVAACVDPRGKARADLPNDPIVSSRSCPNPDPKMTFRSGCGGRDFIDLLQSNIANF